jgi:sporulation protein YlmC with PRC-barrel domain
VPLKSSRQNTFISPPGGAKFHYFSHLSRRPVCAGNIRHRLGKVRDLVFSLREPYPDAVGIYMDYGWGKPTQFVPWDRIVKIEDDAIFVRSPDSGDTYSPFVDQPGWIMADKHLIGRTILDMDGRRIEVVNDVHMLEASGHLLLVHVDSSFNGFLRRWHL